MSDNDLVRRRTQQIYDDHFVFMTISKGEAELLPEDASEPLIQRTRFRNLNQFESMHIMAHLGREILLFTIKYRSHDGLLLIYPDFNNIDVNPYLKEIVSDSRHLYQYAIENLSTDMRSDDEWSLKADIEMMANKVPLHPAISMPLKSFIFLFAFSIAVVAVVHQIAAAIQLATETVHSRQRLH